MRLFSMALLGLVTAAVTACAGTPDKTAPATRQVKVDATNIEEVQKAGYKIVDENGKKMYCRRDLNTGSHVRKTTTCLTEAELVEVLARSRAGVEEMSRHQLPPPSN